MKLRSPLWRALLLPLLLIGLVFPTTFPAAANSFLERLDEFRLPLPDGWTVVDSDVEYPVVIAHAGGVAEVVIVRASFTEEEMVRDADEWKAAVGQVRDSIVLPLPEAQLITSTGYFEDVRARYILEFVSRDTVSNTRVRHRLAGLLYRRESGDQVLYSVWGRASIDHYDVVADDIFMMQESFHFPGPLHESLFPGRSGYSGLNLTLIIGLVALLALLLMRRVQLGRRYGSPEPRRRRLDSSGPRDD